MYRVMIVEDDVTISNEIASHLRKWGYEVVQVLDFEHVVEEFAEENPQLVLLDILLPFYNGYYWCSQIRRLSNESGCTSNTRYKKAARFEGYPMCQLSFSPPLLII